jgi:hypothetical protein
MGGSRGPGHGNAGWGPGHGGAGPGRGTGLEFLLRGRGGGSGGGLPGGMGVSPAMAADLPIQAANIAQMNMIARVHMGGGVPVREPNRSPVMVANTALGPMLVRPRGPGVQAPNIGQSVQAGMLTLPMAHGGSGPLSQVMPINALGTSLSLRFQAKRCRGNHPPISSPSCAVGVLITPRGVWPLFRDSLWRSNATPSPECRSNC